ncbi:hypothetical protein [Risungbinella massiliensis]|uniref:hypothetical protein n=1 Tax=Risungbinella massiliensis TaxID=1329796 RepID=UPI0005CC07BC|nr:hypothetical protein [Risungbinella massiliensis]
MQIKDAIFNWLQIQIVWDARPSDRSAKDTATFFEQMLKEDHQVLNLTSTQDKEAACYVVEYEQNGEKQKQMFPKELAEKLLQDILQEPKYN